MRTLRLQRMDPGLFSLKRALRAAIVIPCVFAFADKVIGDPQTATFAAFGSFAVLVLAEFSGPWRTRLAAYLALAGVGAVFIVVGTLCSRNPLLAAGAMAVVGFAVLFSGVLGGYFVAGGTAAILTFVLPANLPAAPSVIPARLEGWGLAVAAGVSAAMLLWPAQPRDRLRAGIARACVALAELIEAELARDAARAADRAAAAREAVAAVRQVFLATPYRPTGPTGSAQAIAFLVDELEWLESFIPSPPRSGATDDLCPDEHREVLASARAALRDSAARLDGTDRRPDLQRLDRAREDAAAAVRRRILQLPATADPLDLTAALEPSFRLRTLSYSATQIAGYALRATGGASPDLDEMQEARRDRRAALQASAAEAGSTLRTTEHLAAEQVGPGSVVFRNSVRGAVALAASVLIAQEASVQHGFWVVLATLSVLRSNTLTTGATVLSALAGTAVGIVVGAGLIVAIGSNEAVSWAVLPVAVLLAAYAPRVISFAAGQAGFTVVVLILFNIIQPSGWQVGLVRVEDVAIGFAVSIAVGLLFWPRGAGAVLRDRLATAYVRAADSVTAAAQRLVEGGDDAGPTRAAQAAAAAGRRLEDAFRQYLGERSPKRVNAETVATLVGGARRLQRTALSLQTLTGSTARTALGGACAHSLDPELAAFHGWYATLGRALLDRRTPPAQHERDVEARRRVLECAREAVARDDHGMAGEALSLLWASEHLDNLWRLEAHLVEPAEEAVRAAGTGWAHLRVRPSRGTPAPAGER